MMNGSEASAVEMAATCARWRMVADDWALSWRERRALFPAGGDDLSDPPADTEARMRILVEVEHRLRFEDADHLHDWLRDPTQVLNWHSPLEAMSSSLPDLRRFRRFVEQGFGS